MIIQEHEYNAVIDGLRTQLHLHQAKERELVERNKMLVKAHDATTGILNTCIDVARGMPVPNDCPADVVREIGRLYQQSLAADSRIVLLEAELNALKAFELERAGKKKIKQALKTAKDKQVIK